MVVATSNNNVDPDPSTNNDSNNNQQDDYGFQHMDIDNYVPGRSANENIPNPRGNVRLPQPRRNNTPNNANTEFQSIMVEGKKIDVSKL